MVWQLLLSSNTGPLLTTIISSYSQSRNFLIMLYIRETLIIHKVYAPENFANIKTLMHEVETVWDRLSWRN